MNFAPVQCFIDIVSSEFLMRAGKELGNRLSDPQLEAAIVLGLTRLTQLEQGGVCFDLREYSRFAQDAIEKSSDGCESINVFRRYCYFQSLLMIFPEFPELRERFRKAGLDRWLKMRADSRTLKPFAREIVERLGGALLAGELENDQERHDVLELLIQTAGLFSIPISIELGELISCYFPDEMAEGDLPGDDRPRLLN